MAGFELCWIAYRVHALLRLPCRVPKGGLSNGQWAISFPGLVCVKDDEWRAYKDVQGYQRHIRDDRDVLSCTREADSPLPFAGHLTGRAFHRESVSMVWMYWAARAWRRIGGHTAQPGRWLEISDCRQKSLCSALYIVIRGCITISSCRAQDSICRAKHEEALNAAASHTRHGASGELPPRCIAVRGLSTA